MNIVLPEAGPMPMLANFKGDEAHARETIEAPRRAAQAEGQSARVWRVSAGLSRRELAERTGYAERTIAAFEAGEYGADRPIDPKAMQTYRLVCAAIALGVSFDWREARMQLGPAVVSVPVKPIAAP